MEKVMNKLENYPDVLTPDDVMAFLSIGRNTVYNILKTGELPSIRIGKQYRIPKRSVVGFLNSCYNVHNIDG